MFTINGEVKVIDFGLAVSITDKSVVHKELVLSLSSLLICLTWPR